MEIISANEEKIDKNNRSEIILQLANKIREEDIIAWMITTRPCQ